MLSPTQIASLRCRIEESSIPEPNSGCWLWLSSVKNSGYGQIGAASPYTGRRTMLSAHKAAHIVFNGAVPDGGVVRHICDNKLCVNPEHLTVGTQAQNLSDMRGRGRNYWGRQTHCKNGHPFSPENTRSRGGEQSGRRCIACAKEASRRHYHRSAS